MDTALVTSIINSVVAVATLAVAIVAVIGLRENRRLAREDWLHSQQLATVERQHQSRPIVVPVGELSHHTPDGQVDWSPYDTASEQAMDQIARQAAYSEGEYHSVSGATREHEQNTQQFILQNMGDGVALNVHSFLYGPQTGLGNQYTSWNNGPIQGRNGQPILYTHGATILSEQITVDGTHLLYDHSETHYRIARLTTTYHDLFGRRHVSIFDYIRRSPTEHQWMHVTTKSGIEYDLEELDNQRQPAPSKRKPIK